MKDDTSIGLRNTNRIYEIREKEPAPNRGADWEQGRAGGEPYDEDWEAWSTPIGNGTIGANVFGRTDTERIQITEKTLHNEGGRWKGSATNFAELTLALNHGEVCGYRRTLNLNDSLATVTYTSGGVNFLREVFASYPDNLLVLRLKADQPGALTFTIRLDLPFPEQTERSGEVIAEDDLITLSGTDPFFTCHFEAQIKVLNQGGTLSAEDGSIRVEGADSVVLILATGTNYELSERIFTSPPEEKLDHDLYPHGAVTDRIAAGVEKGFDTLRQRHLTDVNQLFGRVTVNLNSSPSDLPTHELLDRYKQGNCDPWLEELMFQYGRYLLIASSRETTLPAHLQGAWTQYHVSPWSGGYWHNINVQMNYWGAMSANLSECFEAYTAYFMAYLPEARRYAEEYVRNAAPDKVEDYGGDNGWIIGTAANAYRVSGPGGHSGPGTGGFTSKLLMDYYLFTRDRDYLENVAYPAMLSLSKFYSKALVPHGEFLLVEPSASPEQIATEEQVAHMPGSLTNPEKGYYVTVGCTFDQGFVWENFHDTLILAEALGKEDPYLDVVREQMTKLDPILVGTSGQIKEFREEEGYSEIGDPHHRHISHLCSLYPGTLINSGTPEWMEAAGYTLDQRGNKTTGWALAHRMNCRARLKQGEQAHGVYRQFIQERTLPNLWTVHPPFQIDGNLGTMAGVVEMLLQSHEGFIDILPALPEAWKDGSFSGLVARGNFVVAADWKEGRVSSLSVTSRSGGECRLSCPGIDQARIQDSEGKQIQAEHPAPEQLRFATRKGMTYSLAFR